MELSELVFWAVAATEHLHGGDLPSGHGGKR